MPTRALIKRLEKAEQAAIMKSKVAPPTPACICFPENEQPFFLLPSQEEAAAQIACPLHGQRFRQPIFHVYVPQWRRESESIRRQRLSPRYHKAWEASCPSDLPDDNLEFVGESGEKNENDSRTDSNISRAS